MNQIKCRVCGKPNPEHIFHCDEHYHCADCGTREGLCTYKEGVLCDPCHALRVGKRIDAFDEDTSFTSEVVCPHCGYEHCDSCSMSEGEMRCDDCDRAFTMDRIVDVRYCTEKLEQ